ncbi:MAG TPA: DUF4956 domain-containing protein [Clostridiales bacterium]|nr:DUF4956 domain-containing protein [Clostridiales bacterium]
MLDSILAATDGTASGILLCTLVSLGLGLVIAGVYIFRNSYNKSFVAMLVLLPAIIQAVIMLVNGNLGVGVAVMGAFSLVRFRSVPGSAREIGTIFFAMAIGLATGMGYLVFAAVLTGIIGAASLVLSGVKWIGGKVEEKRLKVTIPEDLDYTGIFDDLFKEYAYDASLESVRTTNLGSLYELQYRVTLKDNVKEKEFLDKVRCRNGNLNIVCGKLPTNSYEL